MSKLSITEKMDTVNIKFDDGVVVVEITVKEYLKILLSKLWKEGEVLTVKDLLVMVFGNILSI